MIFIVVYTPQNREKEQVAKFFDKVREFPSWAKLNDTAFLVDPNDDTFTAYDVRKAVAETCEDEDRLFVAYITRSASWLGYSQRMFLWVKDHDQQPKSSSDTRDTYDSNQMRIADYYASVSNKIDEDVIPKMISKWVSTWDEMKPMYFDCKDFNKSDILVKFVAEVYMSLQSNVFLHRVKLRNFPENLKEQLLKELNSRGEQDNRQLILQSDFANLFKENEAEIN